MSIGDVLTLLGGTGGGIGLVMLALFITGYIVPKSRVDDIKEERDEWKRTSELERQRADASVAASQIVKDVMISLRKELGPLCSSSSGGSRCVRV
jgi:hypothetical protein